MHFSCSLRFRRRCLPLIRSRSRRIAPCKAQWLGCESAGSEGVTEIALATFSRLIAIYWCLPRLKIPFTMGTRERQGAYYPRTGERAGHPTVYDISLKARSSNSGHSGNAGGVTVSYFEWVQNRQGLYWTAPGVHAQLKQMMESEAAEIWNISTSKDIPLRKAAYVHALRRLAMPSRRMVHSTFHHLRPSVGTRSSAIEVTVEQWPADRGF